MLSGVVLVWRGAARAAGRGSKPTDGVSVL